MASTKSNRRNFLSANIELGSRMTKSVGKKVGLPDMSRTFLLVTVSNSTYFCHDRGYDIHPCLFRVHYNLFSVYVPVKLFFSGFLQNTNFYNLTASLCIALFTDDDILRDTRTWFNQPPVTNEQVPRGQTKQLTETCAVFVKSLLKHSKISRF